MSNAGPLRAEGSAIQSPTDPVRLRFDRGTLLLDGSASLLDSLEPLGLGGVRWDARVATLRAPAYLHADLVRALGALGLSCSDEVSCPLENSGALGARRPSLRPYQSEALEAWEAAGRRGLLAMPTGSGKTRVALAALAALSRPTLVLVPTRVLLGQWLASVREFYGGEIGLVGDGRHALGPITLCTFESAYRHMDSFGNRFGLLIVDEAHHFGSGQRTEALEMCTAAARLGLTATPPEDAEALERLAELVGPVVCRYSIAAMSGRELAPFDSIRLYVRFSKEEQEAYRRSRAVFEEVYCRFCHATGSRSWAEFVAYAGASQGGRQALAAFHQARRVVSLTRAKLDLTARLLDKHREERALIFTADNTAAYALSRRLLIPAITCHISRTERAAVLSRLRQGELRAVVSARVLNEGVDLPDASVGIVMGGALGGREHVQRVGRLLRPVPGKRALIYDIVTRETFEVEHARRRQLHLVA